MEDYSPLSYLLDRQKPLIRWGMVVIFVFCSALILPKFYRTPFTWEAGRPWTGPDLVAEFDFAKFKSPEQYEADKQKALEGVMPVYLFDDKGKIGTLQEVQGRLQEFVKEAEALALKMVTGTEADRETHRQQIIGKFGADPFELWKETPVWESWKSDFPERMGRIVGRLYEGYFVDSSQADTSGDRIAVRMSNKENRVVERSEIMPVSSMSARLNRELQNLSPQEKILASRVIGNSLKPNLKYDSVLSRKERDRALGKVSQVYGRVKAGEIIIARGQLITAEIDNTLNSYLKVTREKFGNAGYLLTLAGQFALMSMMAYMLVLYLRTNRPRIFYRNRKLGMVLLLYLIGISLLVVSQKIHFNVGEEYKLNYAFLAPACIVPILLTAFFDGRFGFFGNILIGLIGGSIVPNGFEYFFVQMVGGTVAVYSLGMLRSRGSFFISLSLILAAYTGAFLGYNFYVTSGLSTIHYGNLILLLVNVGLTFFSWVLIYLFERLFGLTSDLTFVELLDTNHPLLKELFLKAPGTFQHSLQVANISEAVINRIGGNSLKAKVGALFHDVGKIKNPHFFMENIQDDHDPHANLSPEESARIIIQHVPDGVKLAREHNLPSEIIDFIRTHHGTSRTEFFYRHYKEDHPGSEAPDGTFNYPGPLPFTREMAVVMISDTVEAAARSLKDHNPIKLKDLVVNMIDSKVRQNQFVNVNLTFRDVEDMKQVIFLQLVTIYHERIEYPEEKPETGKSATT